MYVPDPPRSSPSRPRLTPQVNHPSSPPFHVKHHLSAAFDPIRKIPSPCRGKSSVNTPIGVFFSPYVKERRPYDSILHTSWLW
ncbi:uncharacterized protein BDW47DRAFT_103682 [Aspergillus candidus]|uniref:Uncharacterized protein n=1 Tax=Aspergillus candidus TaxID=41067 RepID=A0A2I2FEU1_ASPCN|nr:hypothetical protein BDW47DRAFT_103682 [Aspergillus candidus]PLB39099.1 hypothetical protein BDW47DRAFT_103682 [Aspergillus candidus]